MTGRFPDAPYCIPDVTQVPERVAMLNELADEGATDPSVVAFAARARLAAQRMLPYAPTKQGDVYARLLAWELLRAVHDLGYKEAPDMRDCYQPAAYTLRNGGECKALTVLYVAAARALGLRAEPLWIPQPGAPKNHVAAQVWLDGVPMWVEASVPGAMLGEAPEHAAARLGAWAAIGRGREIAADGQSATRTFLPGTVWSWNGWATTWGAWPTSWWQRHYPSLFALPTYRGVVFAPRPALYVPYGAVAFPQGLQFGIYLIRPRTPRPPPPADGQTPQPSAPT